MATAWAEGNLDGLQGCKVAKRQEPHLGAEAEQEDGLVVLHVVDGGQLLL